MSGTQALDNARVGEHHTAERLPMVYPDAPEVERSAMRERLSSWGQPGQLATVLLGCIAATGTALGGLAAMAIVDVPFATAAPTTICIVSTFVARGLFRTRMVPDFASMISRIGSAAAVGALLALTIIVLTPLEQPTSTEFLSVVAVVVVGSLVGQWIGAEVLRQQWKRGKLRSQALIVGTGRLAQELSIEIRNRPTYGVDIVGFVSAQHSAHAHGGLKVLGDVESISEIAHEHRADRIILAPIGGVGPSVLSALRHASTDGLSVFVVPRLYEMGLGLDSLSPDRVRGYPLVRLERASHPRISRVLKRWFDIAVSGLGLLFVSPLLLLGALGVRLSGRGPVLFRQDRVGQHGERFELYKLRTMTPSNKSDIQWDASDRVTPVGSILRRTAIDELPQFYNVLRGDMSLVGPRPERPVFVERFEAEVPGYGDRHRMPVGLTGLAQIVGLRGDTSITERVKYDNLYIDQWSFWSDIQILVKTVWAVMRQGAMSDSHVELHNALEEELSHTHPSLP